MVRLGEKIKKIRKQKGLSQMELAVRSGLHFVTVAELEGTRFPKRSPRLVTLKRLAKALGVDIKELLD